MLIEMTLCYIPLCESRHFNRVLILSYSERFKWRCAPLGVVAFQGPSSGRNNVTLLGCVPSGVTSVSGPVRRALVVKFGDGGRRKGQSLVFQYMQNGGIPIWSASQDGGCHSRTKRVACSMVVIWWQTTAWTWLWVSPESPQCSDRIDGAEASPKVDGEPLKPLYKG